MSTEQQYDVIIVGAGPIGIACGVEAKRRGLRPLLIEKGSLLNAIYEFPTNLVFFSTSNLLEIGDVPFITSGPKPTRLEILRYYTRLAEHYELEFKIYERVEQVLREEDGGYRVSTSRQRSYRASYVVLAIGFYDFPNMLDIPGEDLPKVSHYYREAHPYYRQKVAVIGGQNSAVETALELYRNNAEVTLIHREPKLGRSVKYWIMPDIENRIKEGSIKAYFDTVVTRIDPDTITLQTKGGKPFTIENDFVLAMTGYHPDYDFLEKVGVELNPETKKPSYDPETMQTNVDDVYIAGVACGGLTDINKIFIENGREHAKLLVADILKKMGRKS